MQLPLQTSQVSDQRVLPVIMNNGFGGLRHGFNARANYARDLLPLQPNSSPESYCTSSTFPGETSQFYPRPTSFDRSARSGGPLILEAARSRAASKDSAAMDLCHRTPTPSRVPYMIGDFASAAALSNNTLTENWPSSATRQSMETQPAAQRDTGAYKVASQYTRVAVQDLLNQYTSDQTPTQNNLGNATLSSQAGLSTGSNHPPLAHSTSSFCSCTTTASSSAMEPLSNTTEERAYLLNTLYYTCIDATNSYINSLPPLTRHRHRLNPGRYHPYAHARFTSPNTSTPNSPTLMDNISTISTRLWKKARSDVMAPHREEADAISAMSDLYSWGEIIAQGMEGWNDVIDEGFDTIAELDGAQRDKEITMRIGRAAKSLCEWLGDRDAWENCKEITDDLRGMERNNEVGAGREYLGGGVEVEDEDDIM